MLTGATLLNVRQLEWASRHEAIAGRIFDHALLGDASGKLTPARSKATSITLP